MKTNGYADPDLAKNEPARKKLSFVRKIVKAQDAPGASVELNFPVSSTKREVIDSVNVTEEDPLAVKEDPLATHVKTENVEVNVSPVDVSLIEFDEVDPRELTIKTLEGIVCNDPLALNEESPTKNSSGKDHRICYVCGEFFPSTDQYHCDPENEDDDEPDRPSGHRKCAFCSAFYPSTDLIHGCHRSIANKKSVCSYCNAVFDSQELLDEHMYQHSTLPFICDRCGMFFDTKEDLGSHESMHGASTQCLTCYKVCDDDIALVVHKNPLPIPTECDHCGVLFDSECKLCVHKLDCQPKIEIKEKFPCDECGQIFSQNARLLAHYRQHTGERPFPCKYCHMKFSRKDTLSRHYRKNRLMRSQYGEPFKCFWCFETFEVKCTLYAHEREKHEDDVKRTRKFESDDSMVSNGDGDADDGQWAACVDSATDPESAHVNGTTNVESARVNSATDPEPVRVNNATDPEPVRVKSPTDPEPVRVTSPTDPELVRVNSAVDLEPVRVNSAADLGPVRVDSATDLGPVCVNSAADLGPVRVDSATDLGPVRVNSAVDWEAIRVNRAVDWEPVRVNRNANTVHLADYISNAFRLGHANVSNAYPTELATGQRLRALLENNIDRELRSVGIEKCDLCNLLFFTRRSLNTHLQLVHFGVRQYKCELCTKIFLHQPSLNKHVRRDHAHLCGLKCHVCGRSFPTRRHLTRHQAWHKGAAYKCDVCGTQFTCRKNLLGHQKQRWHFKSSEGLAENVDGNSGDPGLPEAILPDDVGFKPLADPRYGYKVGKTYAQLLVYMDEKGSPPYRCDLCKREFRSKVTFIEHYVGHTMERPFKCVYCNEGFGRESKLEAHLVSHQMREDALRTPTRSNSASPEIKSNSPPPDDSALLSQYQHLNLKIPTIRVNRFDLFASADGTLQASPHENVYKCDKCGRLYGRKASLKSHQRMCKRIRGSVEDQSMTFTGDSQTFMLSGIEHRTYMTNEKREFSCGGCGKIFPTYEFLVKHSMVHTGEKPFKCTICPHREFVLHNSLRKHHRKWHTSVSAVQKCLSTTSAPHREVKKEDVRPREEKKEEKADWTAMCRMELAQRGVESKFNVDAIDIFEPQVIIGKDSKSDDESFDNHSQPPKTIDYVSSRHNNVVKTEETIVIPSSCDYQMLDPKFDDLTMNHFLEPSPPVDAAVDPLDSVATSPPPPPPPPPPNSDPFWDSIVCVQCNAVFGEREDLLVHYTMHDAAGDPMRCVICKRQFTRRVYLTQHAATHKRPRIYQCSYCHKPFRTNRDLVQHERVHTGEKPFPCPQCGRHFRIMKSVRLHLRTHTGEKPHKCGKCPAAFSSWRSYKRHVIKCQEMGTEIVDSVPSTDVVQSVEPLPLLEAED